MSFQLTHEQKPADEIRRVACEQIDLAAGRLSDPNLPHETGVHDARKCCKRIRAVLRLIEPGFDGYRKENRAFRDHARVLSDLRDADVLLETYDKLVTSTPSAVDAEQSVRHKLDGIRQEMVADAGSERTESGAEVVEQMRKARARVQRWIIAGGMEVLFTGFCLTFERGARLMEAARARRSMKNFHEWRKQVKYHWYHTQLMEPLWPQALSAREGPLDELASLLGDEHDLAVMHETLAGAGKPERPFLELVDTRRAELQVQALALGDRLYADMRDLLARAVFVVLAQS